MTALLASLRTEKFLAAAQGKDLRVKQDHTFPKNAIAFCLKFADVRSESLTNIVFYEKPFLKFERILETYLAFAPRGFGSFSKGMPLWIKEKLFQKSILLKELGAILGDNVDWKKRLLFSEHHLSHAASAFYPSPFERAAVLTLDGVGEWTTSSVAIGEKNKLNVVGDPLSTLWLVIFCIYLLYDSR